MNEQEIMTQLNKIFRDVFDLKTVELKTSTTAADIEEWDSLSHLHLIVTIEKHFNIKFTSYEIHRFGNVGDLSGAIAMKLNSK